MNGLHFLWAIVSKRNFGPLFPLFRSLCLDRCFLNVKQKLFNNLIFRHFFYLFKYCYTFNSLFRISSLLLAQERLKINSKTGMEYFLFFPFFSSIRQTWLRVRFLVLSRWINSSNPVICAHSWWKSSSLKIVSPPNHLQEIKLNKSRTCFLKSFEVEEQIFQPYFKQSFTFL